MMKKNHRQLHIIYNIAALLGLLSLAACKTPQATLPKDTIKASLPVATSDTVSAIPVWRDFFQDETLRALIDTALNNNQDLKITLQEMAIAKSNILAKRGQMLPSITANMSVGASKVGRYTADGAGNVGTQITPGHNIPTVTPDIAPSLQLNWTIDLWNQLNSDKRAAVERYLASEDGQRTLKSQLVADVAENYYSLLALDCKLDIMHQYIKLQERAVQIARVQKEADADTQLAVDKFEAELAKASADEYQLRQAITETENNLNMLLGRYPTPILRNKANLMSRQVPSSLQTIPTSLLLKRPDVVQAEHQLEAAKWDVEVARKAFLPSLNVSAALGIDAFNPKYLLRIPKSIAFNVVGGLAAPIINKKAIQANFDQANALQLEALYNYDKVLLSAYSDMTTLQSKAHNLAQYQSMKTKQAEALARAVTAVQQLYNYNRATYLEVLDSEREQLDCQVELIDTQLQQLSALIDLYRGYF